MIWLLYSHNGYYVDIFIKFRRTDLLTLCLMFGLLPWLIHKSSCTIAPKTLNSSRVPGELHIKSFKEDSLFLKWKSRRFLCKYMSGKFPSIPKWVNTMVIWPMMKAHAFAVLSSNELVVDGNTITLEQSLHISPRSFRRQESGIPWDCHFPNRIQIQDEIMYTFNAKTTHTHKMQKLKYECKKKCRLKGFYLNVL